jgi:predicted ATPase with chaperone activity
MPGESHCSPREIQNYLCRISGPLLDRIDLHVEVPAVKFRKITAERTGEASAVIRQRVVAARERQHRRFAARARITCNARMGIAGAGDRVLSPDEAMTSITWRNLLWCLQFQAVTARKLNETAFAAMVVGRLSRLRWWLAWTCNARLAAVII